MKTQSPTSADSSTHRLLLAGSGLLITLVGLETAARSSMVPGSWLPPVSEIGMTLIAEIGHAQFWQDLANTMHGWALGLGLAILVGVPIGMVIGAYHLAYVTVRVPIEFLRPIPSVALIPLAVLVFGPTLDMKVFLVVFGSVFPLLFQAMYGMRDIDPVVRDTARSFRLGRPLTFLRVVLPSVSPYLATGLRISSSIALILAVTAELVVGVPGLGTSIGFAQNAGNAELTYALIIAAGLLGWGLNALFATAERRAMHWHVAYRGGAR